MAPNRVGSMAKSKKHHAFGAKKQKLLQPYIVGAQLSKAQRKKERKNKNVQAQRGSQELTKKDRKVIQGKCVAADADRPKI